MIRAGIWGLGRIGHTFGVAPDGDPLSHSEAYAQLPGAMLSLGVDPDATARARFAARFPAATVLPGGASLPADLRLDVATIATPTDERAAAVEAALRAGARVLLIEKPLAPTYAEAEKLVARCRVAGATVIVNYSRRWTPMMAALRAAIAPNGRLGAPKGVTLRYTGGLVHNGTHWLDLLVALLGTPTDVRPSTFADEGDGGSPTLRFAGGCVARLINVDGVGWSGGEGELWSAAGIVRFSDGGQRVTFQPRAPSLWAGFEALGFAEALVADGAGLHGHLLAAVREAVALAGSRPCATPTCGAAEGLAALSLAARAVEVQPSRVRARPTSTRRTA